MAHYAFLNDDNVVVNVIVGVDENELIEGKDPETWYGQLKGMKCLRTSYNGNIRKNYAGIGYTYDEERDAFIPPKPFSSWTFDEELCNWLPPTPMPDTLDVTYGWNEDAQSWDPIN